VSLLATAADFEQEGGLYWPPYSRFPFFQTRVDELKQRYAPAGQRLLVVGCGYGYLVDDCVAAGYDAYGIDASAYAIGKGQTLLPGIASRLTVADALDAAALDQAAKGWGLKGGTPKWTLLITEDCLPCMTDTEVQTALTNLRARCTTNLAHVVTCGDPAVDKVDPRINWKSVDGWRTVLCPPDVVADSETGLWWNATGQV
jgi:SAM-dependent methyltransferase